MRWQDNEKEYERSVWEIYRKEWETASPEKKVELNKRMRRWQELMKSGLTAQQAYYQATEEESDYRVVEEPSDKQPAISAKPWMHKGALIFLSVALVASIIYSIAITGDRNALSSELEPIQSVLTSTKSTLASTEEILDLTEVELRSTQLDLDSTQSELVSTKETLDSTQSELLSMQSELVATQSDLDITGVELGDTKQSLASTQQQLTVAQETLTGLGITLSTSKECDDVDVVLIDNPTATNPTWSQLMAFLSQDQTEKNTYIEDVYDCSQFSRDVHNNAEAVGIRAAEVQVWFRNEEVGHALNAFLTTDYGLVYVDCTGEPDRVARVRTGKDYRAVELDKITGTNVRNDGWWDSLVVTRPGGTERYSVTSSIIIYW